MTRWQPYPEYRESGLPWLAEVPVHWDIRKLKHISSVTLSSVDKQKIEGERPVHLCNYVDVYYNDYITADLEFMEATASPEEMKRFTLKEGDVVITKDSESWDDIAVPAYVPSDLEAVLCGYHLALIRPDQQVIDGKYLFQSFCASRINEQFTVEATGITRYGLAKHWIDNASFLVAPLPEQRAIAAFLDHQTTKIDALIAEQRHLIELLQERRATLISNAVTKGLDPDVPMKDSGISWLGEVPRHWETRKLKYVTSLLRDGTHQPPPRVDHGIPLLSVRNIVNRRFVNLPDDSLISRDDFAQLQTSFVVKENDVLLAIVGATLGKVAIVEKMPPFAIQRSLAVLRPRQDQLDYRFLSFFLQGEAFQSLLWMRVSFSAQPGIYLGSLANFHIVIPPLSEQHTIVAYLDWETTSIDNLVSEIETNIAHLEEYRTALISAAVTGKIDVRDALPNGRHL